MTSLPITTTLRCAPEPTNCAPTVSAYAKPEHAAERSKPQAFFAPRRSCTRHAVAGNSMSGVTLPDSGARADPFVIGIHNFFQLHVGHHPRRQKSGHACNLRCDAMRHITPCGRVSGLVLQALR